jgi:hypothetical protein
MLMKRQRCRLYVIMSTARSWGANVVLRTADNILEPPREEGEVFRRVRWDRDRGELMLVVG